jgi:hypothetical protein
MEVRSPNFDFEGMTPHWCKNAEFAQMQNASSTVPAYVEPFLVKVMIKAKAKIDPANKKLHDDIGIFIKQEIQHCKAHLAFNKMVADAYPVVRPIEAKYQADYERFLEKKSLRFNIAYSEGFESLSASSVDTFFEEFDEYWADADPRARDLWLWHLAEEYEHRSVMNDTYHALFGGGLYSYLYRLYGFVCAIVHISGHINKISAALIDEDRKSMGPDEIKASEARAQRIKQATAKRAGGHIKRILSPFYNPETRPRARGVEQTLERFAASAPR